MAERLPSPHLVPSSMSAGNTVFDRPDLAMTAPGTQPVDDMGEYVKNVLPEPEPIDKPRSTLVDRGGAKPDATPAETGGATYPGRDEGGWTVIRR